MAFIKPGYLATRAYPNNYWGTNYWPGFFIHGKWVEKWPWEEVSEPLLDIKYGARLELEISVHSVCRFKKYEKKAKSTENILFCLDYDLWLSEN